eukprot:6793110-Prymnesium_polylepis.1
MSTCPLRLLRPPSSLPSARVTGYQGDTPGSQGEYHVRLSGTSKRKGSRTSCHPAPLPRLDVLRAIER